MTENNNRDLASIVATLTELTKAVEAIRGGENTPELDLNDPLNEVLSSGTWTATDASTGTDDAANRILESSGEPRTLRNFLKALLQTHDPDRWYTVRSRATHKRYRVYLAELRNQTTAPDGTTRGVTCTHDFYLPVAPEEVEAGWVIPRVAKVLDVFEWEGEKYLITELINS